MRLASSLGLVLVFGALYFFGLGRVGLLDYDEACYAEVAREMVASGDYLSPRLNGEDFFEKPPLLYWAIAAGYRLFGPSAFAARAINAAVAVLFLLGFYGLSIRPLGERGAWLTCVVLGSSLGFVALARVALTDMLLIAWVTLGLACFHRAFEGAEARGGRVWFWAASCCCGLAMLAKGAIGLLLPVVAVSIYLLLSRRIRLPFRPSWWIPGLLLALPLGLSWYLALGWSHEAGFGFTRVLFWEHHVGRFTQPMQGHRGSPLFYLLPLVVGLFPWSFFAVPAVARSGLLRGNDEERLRYLRLLGIFAGSVLCFFSLAATKLPNYVAPMLPCLAALIGAFLDRRLGLAGTGRRRSRVAFSTVLLLVGAAVGMLAIAPLLRQGPLLLGPNHHKYPALNATVQLGPWPVVAGLVLLATAGLVAASACRRSPRAVVVSLALGGLLFSGVVFLGVMPRVDELLGAPLRHLASRAASEASPGQALVLVGIRHKPSLVFYGGRPTRFVGHDATEALRDLFEGPESHVAIAVAADVERLRVHGSIELIEQRGGYALFRCRPDALKTGSGS